MNDGARFPGCDSEGTVAIELLGLPGVGKSTVSGLLIDKWGFGTFPSVTKVVPKTILLRDCLLSAAAILVGSLLSVFASTKEYVRWHRRQFGVLEEFRVWCYVLGTGFLLRTVDPNLVGRVFDQGPIFSVAWLKLFGRSSSNPLVGKLLDRILLNRLKSLDFLVLLTADSGVLLARVKGRGSMHDLLEIGDTQVQYFLSDYMREFQRIAEMAKENGVRVLDLDTSTEESAGVAVAINDAIAR